MKMPALIVMTVVAILPVALANAQDGVNPPAKEQIEASAQRIKDLQKERIAVLKEVTQQLSRLYQNARVDVDEWLEAKVRLLQAEMDSAEKESDRLTLYKNLVEELTQYEKIAQGQVEAGRGLTASVLKIKARRLEAEIHLEQAKLKNPDLAQQKIMVTSPKAKDVIITQQYVCQIHAQRHIKIRSLPRGYLEEISVKEGQAVKKGDLVFKIVPSFFKAKLDAELAEVKRAEADLKNAERLFNNNAVTQNELALFQAKLAKAQAKAELAKAELNFTVVRAPFDGIIDRLHQQQGSLVQEGDVLTTLSDNSFMWVYFNVPEARYLEYMKGLKENKELKIELVLADGTKFNQLGKLGAIEADFDNESGNIPFRADFPNPDRLLRHGMTGNLLIRRTLNNAIVIPQRATFEVLQKRYVYVVDKDDVAHQREIEIQNELEDIFVIDRGVGVDDRIIFEGIRQVRDGEKVAYEFRSPD